MSDSQLVFDATEQTFGEVVLRASQRVPVVADFWAAWCAPCRVLMPTLDKLVKDYGGRFLLAKVDTDHQQRLAYQYGVRSLPTVKIFKNGQPVDEFFGAQPEAVIRQRIDQHLGSPVDRVRDQALALLARGDLAGAEALLQQALSEKPGDPQLQLDLIGLRIRQGNVDGAEQLLTSLPVRDAETPEAKTLLAQLQFARALQDSPDPAVLRERLERDPNDHQARYRLAAHLVIGGDYAAALDQLFEIMRRDRGFENDLGRRSLVAVFDLLGNQGELVDRYRRRMASLLF